MEPCSNPKIGRVASRHFERTMTIMNLSQRLLRLGIAFSAAGFIASLVPVSGVTALAKNKCQSGAQYQYRVVRGFAANGAAQPTQDLYTGVQVGNVFSAFLNDQSAGTGYQAAASNYSIAGPTGWSIGATGNAAEAAITGVGAGGAVLTATATAVPGLVVTVDLSQ